MAYHYVPIGHTPAIEGRIYSRYPVNSQYSYYSRYKCVKVNEATGCAKLVAVHSGYVCHISIAELSHWHIVGKATE